MEAPIKRALGDDWQQLGAVIRSHYDVTDATPLLVEGTLDVTLSLIGRILIFLGRPLGAQVPYAGNGVPVQVRNGSQGARGDMHWHRTFHYPGRAPVRFPSRMRWDGEGRIVEYVRFGLGICLRLSTEGKTLRYDSCGYRWQVGPLSRHLPDWLLLGRALIREIPLDEQRFAVEFDTVHPLWGKTFSYHGQFQLPDQKPPPTS